MKNQRDIGQHNSSFNDISTKKNETKNEFQWKQFGLTIENEPNGVVNDAAMPPATEPDRAPLNVEVVDDSSIVDKHFLKYSHKGYCIIAKGISRINVAEYPR